MYVQHEHARTLPSNGDHMRKQNEFLNCGKRSAKLIAASLLSILCFQSTALAHAPFSSDYSLEQAKETAQKEGKLLLIDFTASWCPPCQKMEKTTWADSAVQNWIRDNAIALQIDVDKNSKLSDKFKIQAMPTLVLFTPQSGAKEFGRQDGFLSAFELMKWLEGAKSGKTATDLEKELATTDNSAVWEHVNKARELQAAGNIAGAIEEYIWIWNNVKEADPNAGPLRSGLAASEMKRLCAASVEAKAKVAKMRDDAERVNNRHDWIILNGVLDENDRTLAWFDKAKADPAQRATFIAETSSLEGVLFSKSRWSDAANFLYPNPLAKVAEYYKRAEDMKRPRPDTEISKDFDPFPSMVLLLYAAYIGAGRDAEAQKIADECLRLDNTPAMKDALANTAKGMIQARAASAPSSPAHTSPAAKARAVK